MPRVLLFSRGRRHHTPPSGFCGYCMNIVHRYTWAKHPYECNNNKVIKIIIQDRSGSCFLLSSFPPPLTFLGFIVLPRMIFPPQAPGVAGNKGACQCARVEGCVCARYICGGQRTAFWSHFSPSTLTGGRPLLFLSCCVRQVILLSPPPIHCESMRIINSPPIVSHKDTRIINSHHPSTIRVRRLSIHTTHPSQEN